jgi:hypothetical protein
MSTNPFDRAVPTLAQQTQFMVDAVNESARLGELLPDMPAPKFYAVRQARTKVVGSRLMTRAEADREVSAWRANIGPAVAVPDSPEVRRAVRVKDQAALTALLNGEAGAS